MSITRPVLQKNVWRDKPPIGYHTIMVWKSKSKPNKYSFSVTAPGGMGWFSKCGELPEDDFRCFGWFDSPEAAIETAKTYI